MFSSSRQFPRGATLGLAAVTVAFLGFNVPGAVGVDESAGGRSEARQDGGGHHSPGSIVRVGRNFEVRPHSLATNQLIRCPRGTRLTGGGTSLIGEPLRPGTAPVVYTNGPVGNILPGEQQTWASEVANTSGETFTYRQFAVCLVVQPH
jgi:hypothetical protein